MRKKLKSQNSKLKTLVLTAIALLLGIAIYNQQNTKLLTPISPSPPPTPETLTEDERFILNLPSAEASKSALKKHAQIVKKLAQDGNLLEIKDCQSKPLVLKARIGSDLEIKNQSTTNHRIIIDSKHYYDIPKNGSKVIKAEFKYGTGDYGYVCEQVGKAKIAGFLHIIP